MSEKADQPSLIRGRDIIKAHVKQLPETPGVYRMLDKDGTVLYVGKAKALKKRVINYTQINKLSVRLQRMVAATVTMEFVHTHTEAEALLLESNLIKKFKPLYNILLKDNKSFPYILIRDDHEFSQVVKHRGARHEKSGDFFGPFASAGAVNRTITVLQRVFMLRNCSDSYFSVRKRPCLQYHIKRCTAPCVGLVNAQDYGEQVEHARDFLNGKSRMVQDRFARKMQEASEDQNYEKAAQYRDRIRALAAIQNKQDINIANVQDADIFALVQKGGKTCVQVFFFRAGQNFGNHAYFPSHTQDEEIDVILAAFIGQFYANKPVPPVIYVSHLPEQHELIEDALQTMRDPNAAQVRIQHPRRGDKKRLIDFALRNAHDALDRHINARTGTGELHRKLAELFGMETPPERIEIYDNSHISGTNMVGGMIVAGLDGFQKTAYRKFNIKTADAGDDYGMMREVMIRRFERALKESKGPGSSDWPDLLLIDGGKGQLSSVKQALQECGVWDDLCVVAISKGPERNAGREQFHKDGKTAFQLPINDGTLHYLQRLRDEAHRFAIGAHRTRRQGDIIKSPLDQIAGVGPKRKKALLLHFGSAKGVSEAGLQDLKQVEGVSDDMAQAIYDFFH